MKTFRMAVLVYVALLCTAGCATHPNERPESSMQFDTDGDGFLSLEEYSATKISQLVSFDSIDANSDGLLSSQELSIRLRENARRRSRREGQRPQLSS